MGQKSTFIKWHLQIYVDRNLGMRFRGDHYIRISIKNFVYSYFLCKCCRKISQLGSINICAYYKIRDRCEIKNYPCSCILVTIYPKYEKSIPS